MKKSINRLFSLVEWITFKVEEITDIRAAFNEYSKTLTLSVHFVTNENKKDYFDIGVMRSHDGRAGLWYEGEYVNTLLSIEDFALRFNLDTSEFKYQLYDQFGLYSPSIILKKDDIINNYYDEGEQDEWESIDC